MQEKEANHTWAETANISIIDSEIVIFMGMGTGEYFVDVANRKPPYTNFHVVEKDVRYVKYVLENNDLSKILGNTAFYIGIEPDKLAEYLPGWMWSMYCNKFSFIINYPHCMRTDESMNFYYDSWDIIRRELSNYGGEVATLIFTSKIVQENILENFRYILDCPGIVNLKDRFKDVPAVVVAAGPSLDKNIHELKQAKGKAVIIACDTALQALRAAGIEPDLVISIDYSDINLQKLKGQDGAGHYTVLLPAVKNKAFQWFGKKTFITHLPGMFYKFLDKACGEKGTLCGGGSVAHSAFNLAEYMGCETIILIGLDLAYGETESHARNTMHYGSKKRDVLGFEADTWDGTGKVKLTQTFMAFLTFFEILFKRTKCRVIDCTEGGTAKRGSERKPLSEALHWVTGDYCHDFQERLKTAYIAPVIDREKCLAEFNTIITALTEMADNARKSAGISNEVRQSKDPKEVKRLHGYLKAGQEIMHKYENVSELIEVLILRNTYDWHVGIDLMKMHCPKFNDIEYNTRYMVAYLHKYADTCLFYIKRFKKAMEAI